MTVSCGLQARQRNRSDRGPAAEMTALPLPHLPQLVTPVRACVRAIAESPQAHGKHEQPLLITPAYAIHVTSSLIAGARLSLSVHGHPTAADRQGVRDWNPSEDADEYVEHWARYVEVHLGAGPNESSSPETRRKARREQAPVLRYRLGLRKRLRDTEPREVHPGGHHTGRPHGPPRRALPRRADLGCDTALRLTADARAPSTLESRHDQTTHCRDLHRGHD
jgi:hypothetical protein